MMQSVIRRLLVVSLIPLIFACGGEDITDFTEVVDVRLGSLEVVSGGTLMLDDDVVEEFDPDAFGSYTIDLDDDLGATSVDLRVGLDDQNENDVRVEVVEVGKGSDDQDVTASILPGDVFPVRVEEGANLIFIRVSSRNNAARAEYTLQINRISTSALMQDILIGGVRGSLDNSSAVDYSEEFSADVRNYDVFIDSRRCGVEIIPEPEGRFSEIRVNDELVEWQEGVFVPLPEDIIEGESLVSVVVPVVIELTSEDGSESKTYTFNLQKNGESPSDIESDPFLRSLELSPGRATTSFECSASINSPTLNHRVNVADVGSLSLLAEIYASREGVTMTIGDGAINASNNNSIVMLSDTEESFEPGVAYSGVLFDGLEVGTHLFVVAVVSADGDSSYQYNILITVAETNEVYVTNSDELQSALRSAEPNAEIVVASGTYEGVVSAVGSSSGSGHESAHFYSAASGEVDQKIIVRAESDDVILVGADITEHSVLRIEGNYWEIEGIEFSGAQTGIVLDGADSVILKSLSVSNVGERGIVMQNATSNSQVEGGFIDRTGMRDDIEDVPGEGVVIGEGLGEATNNAVRRVEFGRNIANEHITLMVESSDSSIQFNTFESDNTLVLPVENRSLLSVFGGDAEVSYNHFKFDAITGGSDDIAQLINVSTVADEAVEAFQNIFDLDNQSIVVLNNSGSGSVSLVDNRRVDSGVLETNGEIEEGQTPVFQIQSVEDSTLCLARRDVFDSEGESYEDFVIAGVCADDVSQQWILAHMEHGYVQLVQNTDGLNEKMLPKVVQGVSSISFASLTVCDLSDGFISRSCDDSSSVLQWAVETNGDQVSFLNRADSSRYIVEQSEALGDHNLDSPPIRVVPRTSGFESEFTLIRQ